MDRQRGQPRAEVRVVIRDPHGHILLIRRVASPDAPWEFPGGRLAAGMPPESGLRRLCQQELGIELATVIPQRLYVYGAGTHSVTYHCFAAAVVRDTALPCGCAELRWVTAGQLPEYVLASPDRLLAERLRSD